MKIFHIGDISVLFRKFEPRALGFFLRSSNWILIMPSVSAIRKKLHMAQELQMDQIKAPMTDQWLDECSKKATFRSLCTHLWSI